MTLHYTQAALQFTQIADPTTTLPNRAFLQAWHDVARGLTIAPTLRSSGTSPPQVLLDDVIPQSIGLYVDIDTTPGTARGTALYRVFDGGGPPAGESTPIQSGTTAVSIYLARYGRLMQMNPGPYNSNNVYKGVAKQLLSRNSQVSTLIGPATDSAKPVISWALQNNRPALTFVGASTAMIEAPSAAATALLSGSLKEATFFIVARCSTATPSAVQAMFSLGNSGLANPGWFFGQRNGTNLWRTQKISDSGTAPIVDSGALDASWHVFTLILRNVSGAMKVSLRIDSTAIYTDTAQAGDPATINGLCWAGLYRNAAVTNGFAGDIGEDVLYNCAFNTTDATVTEAWLKQRWGIP